MYLTKLFHVSCQAYQDFSIHLANPTRIFETISKLSQHAKTATQNVYQAYTKGMQTKLSFLTRTSPDMEEYLQEPEKQLC